MKNAKDSKSVSLWVLFPFVVSTVVLAMLAILSWTGFTYKENIYEVSCAPDNLQQVYGDKYCVSFIEKRKFFKKDYDIVISRGESGDYGWHINYWQNVEDLAHTKENLDVVWARDFVDLTSWEGNSMRIFRDNFVGGR